MPKRKRPPRKTADKKSVAVKLQTGKGFKLNKNQKSKLDKELDLRQDVLELAEGEVVYCKLIRTIHNKILQGRKWIDSNKLVVELEDGTQKFMWLRSVLETRIKDVSMGSIVAIRYDGKPKNKNYHVYNVSVL